MDSAQTVYCYDLEFLEDGRTIELISIGLVSETGREYYAVNADMPVDRIKNNRWLMNNVWPSLPLRGRKVNTGYPSGESVGVLDTASTLLRPRWVIANEVREFLLAEDEPVLWADFGAYDHVALCQLWGPMIRKPEGIPMFTHDLEQAIALVPGFVKPEQAEGQHNALEDARHNMRVLRALWEAAR
ncbi:putative bacteriophage protein [Nocardia nova SH22a]|uniref:Putative bacteriophage protein n=1 Tax=Nocardia nova SH22a TaxID=1415166 RepID=W5TUA4_9NOCA|nr:3'-5' exoribonuclease [Nocardia nova]AHH20786.1 putative bacteriophage protein [Nocardia nova SH22a]